MFSVKDRSWRQILESLAKEDGGYLSLINEKLWELYRTNPQLRELLNKYGYHTNEDDVKKICISKFKRMFNNLHCSVRPDLEPVRVLTRKFYQQLRKGGDFLTSYDLAIHLHELGFRGEMLDASIYLLSKGEDGVDRVRKTSVILKVKTVIDDPDSNFYRGTDEHSTTRYSKIDQFVKKRNTSLEATKTRYSDMKTKCSRYLLKIMELEEKELRIESKSDMERRENLHHLSLLLRRGIVDDSDLKKEYTSILLSDNRITKFERFRKHAVYYDKVKYLLSGFNDVPQYLYEYKKCIEIFEDFQRHAIPYLRKEGFVLM